MATNDVPAKLVTLVEKMQAEYRTSEYDIAIALARSDDTLSVDELAEETDYTERTVEKRIDTLEEALQGEPLVERDDHDRPILHPALARALREHGD